MSEPGKNPSPKQALKGCLGCLGLILMIGFLGVSCEYLMERFPVEEERPSDTAVEEEQPEPERQSPLYLANLLCRRLVEDEAQYGFRWTDGLLGKKFEPVDALGGETVDFIGDEVELQNGFGAWQRHRYACTVWPGEGRARLNLIEPGRWP